MNQSIQRSFKTIPYHSHPIRLSDLAGLVDDFYFTVPNDIPQWDMRGNHRYHVKYDKDYGFWFGVSLGFLSPTRNYLSEIDQETLDLFLVE